jgi:hypothetical protein
MLREKTLIDGNLVGDRRDAELPEMLLGPAFASVIFLSPRGLGNNLPIWWTLRFDFIVQGRTSSSRYDMLITLTFKFSTT